MADPSENQHGRFVVQRRTTGREDKYTEFAHSDDFQLAQESVRLSDAHYLTRVLDSQLKADYYPLMYPPYIADNMEFMGEFRVDEIDIISEHFKRGLFIKLEHGVILNNVWYEGIYQFLRIHLRLDK